MFKLIAYNALTGEARPLDEIVHTRTQARLRCAELRKEGIPAYYDEVERHRGWSV